VLRGLDIARVRLDTGHGSGALLHPSGGVECIQSFSTIFITQAATYAKVLTGASRPTFWKAVLQELIAPTSRNPPSRGK
jgi:hypothetical protein